jgi:hypothetical protein
MLHTLLIQTKERTRYYRAVLTAARHGGVCPSTRRTPPPANICASHTPYPDAVLAARRWFFASQPASKYSNVCARSRIRQSRPFLTILTNSPRSSSDSSRPLMYIALSQQNHLYKPIILRRYPAVSAFPSIGAAAVENRLSKGGAYSTQINAIVVKTEARIATLSC